MLGGECAIATREIKSFTQSQAGMWIEADLRSLFIDAECCGAESSQRRIKFV